MAARFARQTLKVSRAATIDYGGRRRYRGSEAFAATFRDLGGAITAREIISQSHISKDSTPLGDSDIRRALGRIAQTRPELLYYPVNAYSFSPDGIHVTRLARDLAVFANVRLMGGEAMFSEDFLKAAGDSARGIYFHDPAFDPQEIASRRGPVYPQFLQHYKRKFPRSYLFGGPVDTVETWTSELPFDASMMLFAAIEKVAKKDGAGNTYIGRKALRDTLHATRDFPGITGKLSCNRNRSCGFPAASVYQFASTTWKPGENPKRVYP